MLKLNTNQKRLPVGGHQFKDRGVTFTGDTMDQVEKKLRAFRLYNCLPMGDPNQEILRYYALHWPYMVREDREATEAPQITEFAEWRGWVTKAWANPPRLLVTSKEAGDRWLICSDCPFNQPFTWLETDESSELSRRTYLLRRGASVPQNLGFCSLHKADLSVFTFLDQAASLSAKKDNEENESCWV